MINQIKNSICMPIPKCGTQSLATTLKRLGGHDIPNVHTLRDIKDQETYNFIFTFVRHPVERLISGYYNSKKYGNKRSLLDHLKFLNDVDFENYELCYASMGPGIPDYNSTDSYIITHHIPQSVYLDTRPDNLFIGYFSNIQEDWKYIAKKLL